MRFYKIIISLTLLFTYSLGFVHNLVPHCSSISSHESHSSHQHHSHDEPHEENHIHVLHENHVDEGILDYILCVVNESANEGNECIEEHFFTLQSNTVSLKKINHIPTTIVLFTISNKLADALITINYNFKKNSFYSSSTLENASLRGPPTS